MPSWSESRQETFVMIDKGTPVIYKDQSVFNEKGFNLNKVSFKTSLKRFSFCEDLNKTNLQRPFTKIVLNLRNILIVSDTQDKRILKLFNDFLQ